MTGPEVIRVETCVIEAAHQIQAKPQLWLAVDSTLVETIALIIYGHIPEA